MSDSTIIGAIMAELNTGREVGEQLLVYIGEKFIAEHGAPPRLVWVQTRDTFTHPAPGYGTEADRQIFTDNAEYAVHCWGADSDMTRVLMLEVARAVHRLCGKNATVGPAEWRTEGEVEHNGSLVILSVTLALGVADQSETRAKVEVATAAADETDAGPVVNITLGSHPEE